MIDRYHLRYFLAVIDHGNFSKAAHACNVSQPTLSVGISKLEKALGKALFHRTNRRVELTPAGARLFDYARRIEENFALAERDIAEASMAATIRIGVLTTTPGVWMKRFLVAHGAQGAGERIEIVEGKERDLQDRLARGRIDVALTIVRDDPAKGGHDVLFTEGYSLAMAAGHPLGHRRAIAAEELIGEAMIVRRHCELLSQTSRFFTERKVRPFFSARTTSDDRAIGYVQAGLGITVMPDSFVAEGIVRPTISEFTFTRDIGLIYAPHLGSEMRRTDPIRLLMQMIEQSRAPGQAE